MIGGMALLALVAARSPARTAVHEDADWPLRR